MDSFSTSQQSFDGIEKLAREKADLLVDERIGQRVPLVMNGLTIAQ
jgi:WASH complex subunit 7